MHAVSQKVAGPEDELQEANTNPITTVTRIAKINLINDLFKTKQK
jgi:hypothetical protein